MDVHLVVKYAVHHSKTVLTPSFVQCWPVLEILDFSKEVTLLLHSKLPVAFWTHVR